MRVGSGRREEEREIRREAILAAAERVFIERGFEAATMDEVAAAADFTKRTVYQYFEGKEELLFTIAARLLAKTPLSFNSADSVNASARDRLDAFVLGFYASIRARPGESALMDKALALRSAYRVRSAASQSTGPGSLLLESKLSELYSSFLGALEEGRRDGSLREDLQSEGAAFAIFFLLRGFLGFVAHEEVGATVSGRMSGDELARYALNLVVEGMASMPR